MSRKYRVDEILAELSDADRTEYQAILRRPASTIDDLLQWLGDHGMKVSRGAVWKHRKNFDEELDAVRRTAEMCRAFTQVAREGGAEAISEANLGRFEQLLASKLMQMNAEGELDSGELMKLSQSLNAAANTRQRIEAVKAEYEKRQREAIEQAKQAAESGASGQNVVDVFKRAMGITVQA